jgi:TonB family protein
MAQVILRSVAAFCFLALLVPVGTAGAVSPSGSHMYCTEDLEEIIPPEVINKSEVRFALEAVELWFSENRIAGGTATVEVLVGEDGQVKLTRICKSSNNFYVDEMGATIAGMMRFEPAERAEKPIETWITIPIQIAPGHRDPTESFALPLPRL